MARGTSPTQPASPNGDHVDHLVEQWRLARPDLDVSPMGVIARISRLSRILERQIEEVYGAYGLNQAQFGVLAALRRAGPPFCLSPTALYNSLLKNVSRFPDVVIGAPNLQDTTVECDGMSIGIGFDVDTIQPVTEIIDPPPEKPSECADAGVDGGS